MNIQKAYDVARSSHNNNQPKPASQETQKTNTTLAAENVDKFEKDSTAYRANYNRETYKSDYANINRDDFRKMAASSARQLKNDAVRSMAQSQVNGQIQKNSFSPYFNKNQTVMNAYQAAEASSEKHADYWGVEATAERIVTFAKTLAGNDDKMFDTMKNAFLKGFRQAEGARGGKLPSISYETKNRALEMFDEWEAEIKAKNAPAQPQADKA